MSKLLLTLMMLTCALMFEAAAQAQFATPDAAPASMFADPEPQPLGSVAPQPYESAAPADFVVVSASHDFYNSRLPVVADRRLRVFVRTYDASRGVYMDTEVPEPQCLLSCRRREAQLSPGP